MWGMGQRNISISALTAHSSFSISASQNSLWVACSAIYTLTVWPTTQETLRCCIICCEVWRGNVSVCACVSVCYLTSRLIPCLLFLLLWATSAREIHTWRTLSVGYCMFNSSHSTHPEPIRTPFCFIWSHLCHVIHVSSFILNNFFSLFLPFTFWHMHGNYHLDLFVLVMKYKLCSQT